MIAWLVAAWVVGTLPAAWLHGWIVRGWPNRSGEEPTDDDAHGLVAAAVILWPILIPALLIAVLLTQGPTRSPWGRLNRAGYARRARKQPR